MIFLVPWDQAWSPERPAHVFKACLQGPETVFYTLDSGILASSPSFTSAGQGTVKLGEAWASEISLYPRMSDSQSHILPLQVWFGFAYCRLGEAEEQAGRDQVTRGHVTSLSASLQS